MKRTIIVFTILSCLQSTVILSQSKQDLVLAESVFELDEKQKYTFELSDENELQYSTKLLFATYKNFFSSQDQQACNFHPSCSVYAMESIKEHGFTKGSLYAFDRLTRCHPLNREAYSVHEETGLLYDPIEK